jgi:type VI secretion system secreted protein VgrG
MASATDMISSLIKRDGGKRLLKLYFPRDDGPNAPLLINHLHAVEHVSSDFIYTLTLLSDDAEIELKDVICKMVCVELMRANHAERYFNGYCHEFALKRIENGLAVYQMVLKPWLAFFDLRKDFHIFHNQSIEQQTQEMLLEMGLSDADIRILEADPRRTFSVQYDETDYNYLHRRWEEMGWHYHYEHSMKGHKLILASNSPTCEPIDGKPEIAWHHDGGDNRIDKITRFSPMRQVVSGKVALSNFDFKSPRPQRLSETSEMNQGDAFYKAEIYDYEGLYGYKNEADGRNIARRRMEQIEAQGKQFHALGNHRAVQPGRWFRLTRDYESQLFDGSASENEFFIISATHEADNNFLNSSGQHAGYSNEFTCLRRSIPWRPEPGLNSHTVTVPGIDTAIVVGPAGEEIHTDKYGRIKVHFHWDRRGKYDENSSCWLRVMTPWADSGFGMVSLPRVGTEVVIQYLQGNPDRPLVIGQLYNQSHMPPWDLPGNKTQSGIISRSSTGASPDNANWLRFEDQKGNEQLFIHAEKDQKIEVEHDESHWVGHDRKKTIDHDETTLVKHDRTETVDHDETITVHNNRKERVDHNEDISIGDNRTEKVGKNEDITIGNNRTEKVGDNEDISIGKNRSEKVGDNEDISIGKNRSEKVGNNEDISIGDNRSKNVGKNESDTIGDNWNINVGKMKSETIGMGNTQTVALFKMMNIGAAYSVNVGAGMMTNVGLGRMDTVGMMWSQNTGTKHMHTVGLEYTLTVGAASLTLKADGTIILKGKDIQILGSGDIAVKADDNMVLKATQIDQN